jgi:Short C-terminal domain
MDFDDRPRIGSKFNLPQDVLDVAGLRSAVIAWTAVDPDLKGDVACHTFCNSFDKYLIPCLWPHLVLCFPCLCLKWVNAENDVLSQVWILTETELKIVSMGYDTCLLPGLYQSGDTVKTIPLENIVDCGVKQSGRGLFNMFVMPEVYIDTANCGGRDEHEATGVALAEHQLFIQEILNQRDVVKGRARKIVAVPVMDGGGRTAEDRMEEVSKLHAKGILTQQEYEKKRQEIIDSI